MLLSEDQRVQDVQDAEALSDDELDELLVEEVSIDGMCGVYLASLKSGFPNSLLCSTPTRRGACIPRSLCVMSRSARSPTTSAPAA